MRKFLLLVSALFLQYAVAGWCDTVTLRDGSRYNGVFLNGTSREINFQDDLGVRRRFNTSDVLSVEFQAGSPASAWPARGRGAGVSAETATRTIPTGTELVVRPNEEINSQATSRDRTYSAVIDRDIMDSSGALAIPRGSPAQLVIRDVSTGGTFGTPELALDIQSVDIGGQRFLVSTQNLEQRGRGGIGANRRTGEMVGGGAVLGTVLGAIAGGGKGAVLGAIAGAAAGGAVQVLTRGKEVKVPAETVLTFRLDQPMQLQPAGR